MATSVGVSPPTWAVIPSPGVPATVAKSAFIALYVSSRPWSESPASWRTA